MSVMNYQCPNCLAPLTFHAENQEHMECEYCGSTFTIAEVDAFYQAQRKSAEQAPPKAESAEWMGEEFRDMLLYSCPSCGAEILGDAHMGATQCLYCGNPTVIPQQFSGDFKPELIIPFAKTREDAIAAMKNHFKGKILLPSSFTAENRLQEVRGLYVPVWLYDCQASGSAEYECRNMTTWADDDYYYTRTMFFQADRAGNMSFANIPVDGSTKMKDEFMESVEPFHPEAAVPFSPAYLAGYYADKYDQDQAACEGRARERACASVISSLHDTVHGYDTFHEESSFADVDSIQAKYALFPVWILTTRFRDKPYTFVMNGQTGRFVGDLPLDTGKMWAWFGGVAGISAVVAFLGELLLRLTEVLG